MDDARLCTLLRGISQSQDGFPHVLSVISEPTSIRIGLGVPADLCWFRGHFPERPVLPGIVQLHWAVLVCRAAYELGGSPSEVKRLKFKRMVEPPAEIELTVSRAGEREARFSFATLGEQNSEGTIIFPAGT